MDVSQIAKNDESIESLPFGFSLMSLTKDFYGLFHLVIHPRNFLFLSKKKYIEF